jgi:hypothetical protein
MLQQAQNGEAQTLYTRRKGGLQPLKFTYMEHGPFDAASLLNATEAHGWTEKPKQKACYDQYGQGYGLCVNQRPGSCLSGPNR